MENAMQKTKWVVDPSHSEVNFKVKHLMISNVKGEFQKFDVEMEGDTLKDATGIKVSIDTASVSTNNTDRDNHLKSEDFFDSEKFPQMKFVGESIKKIDDEEYALTGDLTIKDTSKKIELSVELGGKVKDPYGNEKLGFSVSGKLNRKEWGLNWNTVLETGGVMVSEEVKINAEIQLIKQG